MFHKKFFSINDFPTSQKTTNPTIVIIDDDESCNISLRLMLHDLHLNIICFTKGQEGLKYILTNYDKISLILLDLMMPDINGLDVIKNLKNNKFTTHIPLILQTGMTERKFLDQGFECGMNDYIFKPYDKQNIIKAIQSNILDYKKV
jgi:two-component system sensor histidine kinase ChiS